MEELFFSAAELSEVLDIPVKEVGRLAKSKIFKKTVKGYNAKKSIYGYITHLKTMHCVWECLEMLEASVRRDMIIEIRARMRIELETMLRQNSITLNGNNREKIIAALMEGKAEALKEWGKYQR